MGALKGRSPCPGQDSIHWPKGLENFITKATCEGGLLSFFRQEMRGFNDLLRQKPFFLSVFLDWIPFSVASLFLPSNHLN